MSHCCLLEREMSGRTTAMLVNTEAVMNARVTMGTSKYHASRGSLAPPSILRFCRYGDVVNVGQDYKVGISGEVQATSRNSRFQSGPSHRPPAGGHSAFGINSGESPIKIPRMTANRNFFVWDKFGTIESPKLYMW
jgi:hypothetical protein